MEKMKRGKKIEEGEEYNNPLGDRLRQYVRVQQLVPWTQIFIWIR